MKKIAFLLSFLLLPLFTIQILAQVEEDVPLPKSLRQVEPEREKSRIKMMGGGNLGLQFGSYTAVSLSPTFGIYPVEWILVGVSATYMYSYDTYYNLSSNVFGFSAFLQGLVLKKRLILYAGYEYVNYDLFYQDNLGPILKMRNDSHGIFLGPGYRQPISDNLAAYGLILFDIIQSYDSFYGNPIIRFGVVYDF